MPQATAHQLSELQGPGGGYAMLAIDQREALRQMFAAHTDHEITDQDLQDFKLTAARILTPHASAVLVDRQFAWDAVVEQGVVAPDCALIAAADHFESAGGELVGRVTIDERVDPVAVARQGAAALKLLVLWREDEPAAARIAMVEEFVERAHRAGLLAIIEPVARGRADGRPSDPEAGVLAAAQELGALGADLYKAEVPFKGRAEDDAVRRASAELTSAIASPWVVLSSGVDEDRFPEAVALAMAEGADGFLAGRAVWASSIGTPQVAADLADNAVRRLQRLAAVVENAMAARR